MRDLGKRILIGSGAIGTVLRTGLGLPQEPVELLNLRRPQEVAALHRAYRKAGSAILVTNTFAANPLRLGEGADASLCRSVNEAGVRLARDAAEDACLVWASVGPLNLGLGHEDYDEQELQRLYFIQCEALKGADAIVLETFVDPREARAAMAAAKATGLPFIFQMGNTGRGRNRWLAAEILLAEAERAGAAAVGANCQHPEDLLEVIAYLRGKTALPLCAAPNAGNPRFERGLITYEFSPADFVAVAERLANLGAAVIGGCCGTTPGHIERIAPLIAGRPVSPRPMAGEGAAQPSPRKSMAGGSHNPIRSLMQGRRFLISVEIRADRNTPLDVLCRKAELLAAAGADLLDVPENPGATVHRDAAVTAARLQEVLKIPAICHKSVTQANLLQLHSSLLGLWDLGLRGLLAVTGDPPSLGHLGALASRVTDLKSSVELLRLVRKLRQGELINGDILSAPPDLCAGAAVGRPTPGQIAWLAKKVKAGAEFVFSQPLFSADDLNRLFEETTRMGVRLFPGLLPILSRRSAERLASGHIPGIFVPREILSGFERYEQASDQRRFGLETALGLAKLMAEQTQGIYLIPPFGKGAFEEAELLVRAVKGEADPVSGKG